MDCRKEKDPPPLSSAQFSLTHLVNVKIVIIFESFVWIYFLYNENPLVVCDSGIAW